MSASASRTDSGLPSASSTLAIARIDGHPGADGGLREVNRRDIAALQVRERDRQLGLERSDELAAGRSGGARWALAADEDDAGGKGIACPCPIMRLPSSVRIGQVPLIAKPARITHRGKSPNRCWLCPASVSLSDCLKA